MWWCWPAICASCRRACQARILQQRRADPAAGETGQELSERGGRLVDVGHAELALLAQLGTRGGIGEEACRQGRVPGGESGGLIGEPAATKQRERISQLIPMLFHRDLAHEPAAPEPRALESATRSAP